MEPNTQVVVPYKHASGVTELTPGTVVSATGESVSVQLRDTEQVKSFPKDSVQLASKVFGEAANFDNQNEMPVIRQFPKHMI